MKKSKYYTQCLLQKQTASGWLKTVAWIPDVFAEEGKILKLKDENDNWSDHWQVEKVFNTLLEEFVLEHERDFTRQRKASDI
jgi:hypothetical protein